ncbi:MAG: MBL fold metallo-hydrolase [Candidatus Bathyarchaeota archaeon]|nr:MBL fold metallo-hydrolase [Candidatus Bathyarchaeota archaeon]
MEIFDRTGEFERDLFYVDTLAHNMKRSIGVLVCRNKMGNIIFDSGMPNSSNEILNSLLKLGIDPDSTRFILLTHRHIDHAGGSAALLNKLHSSHTQAGIHPFSAKHLAEPSKVFEGGKELFGSFATRMSPVQNSSIRTLQDNEEIYLGQEVVEVIYSPGHTSDHISYFIPSKKILYCGDIVGSFNPKTHKVYPTCLYPSFDYQKYKTTIKRLRSINFETLVFSHFGVVIGKDTKQILDYSLESHQTLEKIVKEHNAKPNKEKLIQEIKVALKEATEIFPSAVRERAAEYMARGFLKGFYLSVS